MNEKEIITKLEDFNKQAEDLFKLSFIEKSVDSGYTISARKGEPVKCTLKGPDDESIKAFVNDVRRFFQKMIL